MKNGLVLAVSLAMAGCLSESNDNNGQASQIDNEKPVVTAFALPSNSNSLVVPVSSFTASDNLAVTGYAITSTDTPPPATDGRWLSTAPTSFSFPSAGNYAAYAWARDAAGNISLSRTSQVAIALASSQNYSGTWVGSFGGMTLTYLITQNGTSLDITSVPTLLTAAQRYSGTISGVTSVISTVDYATASATLTAIDSNTVRVVQDSCVAVPANAIYCVVPVGTAITFTRS